MRRNTPTRLAVRPDIRSAFTRLCALAVLAAAALHAAPARAALSPLDDTQLSEMRGQARDEQRDNRPPALPVVGGLLRLLPADHLHLSVLDRAAFEAALAEHGMAPLAAGLYDGRPVTQISVDGAPVNASFEAGALLAPLGVHYQGPSMGTIQINGFDARGTTLWVWTH
ncbi:hypothetical protein [Ideonella sp. BN130291]|uniref:hypothetical protein n=1 Tax=Ideonella sp. BN130291 TaxID=3112940 RepID=UPI002E261192|nr:hypothetical protein [Ideonella sp. BN130291]